MASSLVRPRKRRRKFSSGVSLCHCDLALRSESCLVGSQKAGYTLLAIETRAISKSVLKIPEQRQSTGNSNSGPLKRLTIVLDNQDNLDGLKVKMTRLFQYDILSVLPTDENTFIYACEKMVDVDIITLDSSNGLNFYLNHSAVTTAVARGLTFELQYSDAFSSLTSRKHFLVTAMRIIDATRGGKHLIFSSGASKDMHLRRPHDIMNLGKLCGIKKDEYASGILCKYPHEAIEHGRRRHEKL